MTNLLLGLVASKLADKVKKSNLNKGGNTKSKSESAPVADKSGRSEAKMKSPAKSKSSKAKSTKASPDTKNTSRASDVSYLHSILTRSRCFGLWRQDRVDNRSLILSRKKLPKKRTWLIRSRRRKTF